MENKALSWVMAARKFGLVNADEMFPENDEPRRKRPTEKLGSHAEIEGWQYH